jgi:hypothetical protein
MCDILVLTSALAYAAHHLRPHSIPIDHPNLGFSLPCTQFALSITLPIRGPLEAALNNETATYMVLQVEEVKPPEHGVDEDNVPTFGIGDILANVIAPIFSSYYERQKDWLKSNVSDDPARWPMLLQFSRVARNAAVHFGEITISNKNAKPVSWRGLTYGPENNGRKIHTVDMNTGDFIALMVEMNEELTALGAPHL